MSNVPVFYPNRRLPFYFGDLYQIESKLSGYELVGVQRIVNVMAGQYAENKTTREEITESSFFEELENEEMRENSRTESISESLQTSTQSTLAKSSGFSANAGFEANFGYAKAYTGVGFDTQTAKTTSRSEAQSFAKQITETASNTVRQRSIRNRSGSASLRILEEQTRGLDNRGGSSAAMITRFVEEVHEFKLVQHKKHLFTRFIVPSPAANYMNALESGRAQQNTVAEIADTVKYQASGSNVTKEIFPKDLNEGNWFDVASYFGIVDPVTPPPKLSLNVAFQADDESGYEKIHMSSKEITVPEGYIPTHAKIDGELSAWNPTEPNTHWQTVNTAGFIGAERIDYMNWGTDSRNRSGNTITMYESGDGKAVFTFFSASYDFGAFNCHIELSPSERLMKLWQLEFYQQIKDTLSSRRPAENETAEALDLIEVADLSASPTAAKRMIHQELCRLALQFVLGTDLTGLGGVDRQALDFPLYPQIDYARVNDLQLTMDFLDKVFDFEKMTYRFLPHYLGGAEQRLSAFGQSTTGVLNEFLNAGAVEIILPVTLLKEEQLLYFLHTGLIMGGEDIPLPYDRNALALYDEIIEARAMEQSDDPIEIDSWTENLSTEHVILQDGAALPDWKSNAVPGPVSGNTLTPVGSE